MAFTVEDGNDKEYIPIDNPIHLIIAEPDEEIED